MNKLLKILTKSLLGVGNIPLEAFFYSANASNSLRRLGGRPGLVVMGGDSYSGGHGLES